MPNLLYRQYMLERSTNSRIIIPAPQSPNSLHFPHEESKTFSDVRIFISPKYDSHPLTMAQSAISGRRFAPFFQAFELGHLFGNKVLSEEEAAVFANLRQEDEDKFRTPERQAENAEKNWSSFKPVENPLLRTSASNPGRVAPAEPKKSRPKEKGLRKLSQRAYEIVLKMRSASYKEVANKLVDELNSEQELDQEGKDQQNIKRRVYDALNVLIALGVLRKEGRKIIGDRDNQLSFQQSHANDMEKELDERRRVIASKRAKLKDLQEKAALYRSLAETHARANEVGDVIRFPFMVLWNEKEGRVEAKGWQGEEAGMGMKAECNQLMMRWPRTESDHCQSDINFLLNYRKAQHQTRAR